MMDKKKATAPGSSVGADGKQPLCNKHNEIITDDQRQNNLQATGNVGITDKKVSPGKSRQDILQTVTMEELYDTVYPPKVPIVDGLLYNGTYLFVGAPKVGKSFFMAQLGYHVSRGIPLWDYPVNGGTVLYLALEDDYGRLQKRLSRMFGVESTDAFHLATRSKTLNQGLEEQLSRFVAEHKDARLIIIDTLQKVREVGGDKYSYASDYDIVTRLKKFSDEHAVCLLLVHHTRKLESSDSFDMISGTNGLLGAADGAFVMQKEKRTQNKATLDVVGRDQPDQRLYLNFDREQCIWKLVKAETELWKEPPDEVLEQIVDFMSLRQSWQGTATELLQELRGVNMQPNVLTRKLNVSVERLYLDHGICYAASRGHNGRVISLEKKDNVVDHVVKDEELVKNSTNSPAS